MTSAQRPDLLLHVACLHHSPNAPASFPLLGHTTLFPTSGPWHVLLLLSETLSPPHLCMSTPSHCSGLCSNVKSPERPPWPLLSGGLSPLPPTHHHPPSTSATLSEIFLSHLPMKSGYFVLAPGRELAVSATASPGPSTVPDTQYKLVE